VKVIAFVLLILLIWLQYKIWLQEGGIPEVLQLQKDVAVEQAEVEKLQERNQSLDAEVKDLKKGLDAIEERARSEMGMIKKGEVYFQVIETEKNKSDNAVTGKSMPVTTRQEQQDRNKQDRNKQSERK